MINKKIISMLMMSLVLMMPIYSSLAFAQLTNIEIHGENNIDGYRKATDYTEVILDAISTSPPSGNQVQYKDSEIEANFNCQDMADGKTSHCTFKSSVDTKTNRKYFYLILLDENGDLIETLEKSIVIDNTPPELIFSIDESIISFGQPITLSYNIRDYAYPGSSGCAGLESVTFSVEGIPFKEILLNETCQSSGSFQVDLVSEGFIAPDYSGSVEITASATDIFGNSGTALSQSFEMDQTEPTVTEIKLLRLAKFIRGRDNLVDLVYVPKNKNYAVVIKAKFPDPDNDVNPSSIRANLSGIYPRSVADGQGSYDNMVADDCVKEDDTYECIWATASAQRPIYVRIDSSRSVRMDFFVADKFGNEAKVTAMPSLTIDDKPPTISGFSSPFTNSGKYFLRKGYNNITVVFNEKGSMIDSHAWLDLSSFGLPTSVRATKCIEKSGSQWTCVWERVNIQGNDGENKKVFLVHSKITETIGYITDYNGSSNVFIPNRVEGVVGVSDDYNNLADLTGTNNNVDFKIDALKPVIINSTVRSSGNHDYNFTISGDSFEFEVNLIDTSYITAKANMSEFIDDSSIYDATCKVTSTTKSNQNIIQCIWKPSSAINVPATGDASIKAVFVDTVGNRLEKEFGPFEILEFSNITTDSWKINKATVMPELVDREAAELIPTEVFVSVPFTGSGRKMLDLSLKDCYGHDVEIDNTKSNSKDLISKLEVMNTEALDSPNPYVLVTLKTAKMKADSLKLTCEFQSVSTDGVYIYDPEYDNATFEIKFYNNPLGMIDENLVKKINDTRNGVDNDFWKLIGLLDTIQKYATMACRAFNTIQNIQKVMSLLEFKHEVIAFTQAQIPTERPAAYPTATRAKLICEKTQNLKQTGDGMWETTVSGLCKIVNCEYSKPKGEDGKSSYWDGSLGHEKMSSIRKAGIPFGWHEEPSQFMNAKDSLAVSIMTACVPGVIYNLNKLRNIQCYYLDCLENQIPRGVPEDTCSELKDVQVCKYVVGEVFQFVGIAVFFDWIAGKVKAALHDPFALIGHLAGIGCQGLCSENPDKLPGFGWGWCIGWKIVGMIGEVAGQISGIVSGDSWKLEQDYCEKVGIGGFSLGGGGENEA